MQKEKNNQAWQRLEAVIQWAGMSINFFARHIGFQRGENLYQIRRGNNGISKQLARRVVEHFPEVSELWLLTGSGEMFLHETVESRIPYYHLDVEQALPELGELQPDEYLYLPLVGGAELAVGYRGEAMSPRIPAGSILFLKGVQPESLVPGNAYVLRLEDRVVFRTVRRTTGSRWRLEAVAKSRYDDFEIEKGCVRQAWRLCAHLMLNNE